MSPSQLDIRLLGPVEVRGDGTPRALPPSRKARALLGYLVATRRPHGRSELCDLLWEGAEDPRGSLRWALTKLRSVVDGGDQPRIVTSGDRVAFDCEDVQVDVHQVRCVTPDGPLQALERAVGAFQGEFLEDLDALDGHDFQTWCLGVREDLRSHHLMLRKGLVDRLRGEPEAALPHALARVRLDPFAEAGYVDAMDLLRELGSMDRALALYERCRRILDEEFGAAPSHELEEARRRIEAPAQASRRADEADVPGGVAGRASGTGREPRALASALATLPTPEGLPEPGPDDPPLVGRSRERRALSRALRAVGERSEQGAVLLTGEPGIGKTRLLRELVGEVRATGGWVLCGPVFEAEGIRPYGPWTDLIRTVPAAARGGDLQRDLSPLLADPAHRERGEGPSEQARLFEAVARLLERLASARSPGLVVLDDLHWLDPSSAALLHYVARRRIDAPLLLALAAREEEMEEASAQARALRSLSRAGRLRRIVLGRLGAAETERLVQSISARADAERIISASEGNPLFALALLAAQREGVADAPTTIEEELSHRLQRLDAGDRSLLPWAAALGRAFDVTRLVQVMDRSTAEVVDSLARLERRGILRPAGADRYDFSHSLLRQAAYRRVPEPGRRAVHRTIALVLARSEEEGRGAPAIVAHHADLGGLRELAARSYLAGAEHALWLLSLDEAGDQVTRGLDQVASLADGTRIPLEMELLRVYGFRNMRDRRPPDLETRVRRVTEEARKAELTGTVSVGHAVLTELEYQRGAFSEAAESSRRSARAGIDSEPHTAIRALAETGACLLLLDHAPEDARRLTAEAFSLAGRHGLELDVVALARALLQHRDGELDEAVRSFEEVILLGRRNRDRWWESPALIRMVMVELDRDDPDAASGRAREAEDLAEQVGDEPEAVFARALAAVADERIAARAGASASEPGHAVEEALRRLRTLDSLWHVGHVQAYAAEVDLRNECPDAARERAEEAAEAARALNLPSLRAHARALLAQAAAVRGSMDEAARHLDAPEVARPPHPLSHRARRTLRRVREMVSS